MPAKFMVNDGTYNPGSGRLPHGLGSIPSAGTNVYARRLQRLRDRSYKPMQQCSTHWAGTISGL